MADAVKNLDLIGRACFVDTTVKFLETISNTKLFESDLKLTSLLFAGICLAVGVKELAADGGRAQVILDVWKSFIDLMVSFFKLLEGLLSTARYYIERGTFVLKRRCEGAKIRLELMVALHQAEVEQWNAIHRKPDSAFK